MNTNGGGMSYAHTGAYGMLCMLESIRQRQMTLPLAASTLKTVPS